MTWEGRAGFDEPYVQLADGYRQCARAVDAWSAARRIESSAQATLEEKGRSVADLDYQLAELRGALASHEQAVDRERETAHQRLVDRNARAERVEARLLELATLFCEPLRGRPELENLFRRLETEAFS